MVRLFIHTADMQLDGNFPPEQAIRAAHFVLTHALDESQRTAPKTENELAVNPPLSQVAQTEDEGAGV